LHLTDPPSPVAKSTYIGVAVATAEVPPAEAVADIDFHADGLIQSHVARFTTVDVVGFVSMSGDGRRIDDSAVCASWARDSVRDFFGVADLITLVPDPGQTAR
jgi:hypothetical protein